MIRIGNQTSFAAARPAAPFEFALEHGFDAFEWFPDRDEAGRGWDEGDFNGETRGEIRRVARQADISLSVHVPWWLDPAQAGSSSRFAALATFAQDLGATLVNVHLFLQAGLERYAASVTPLVQHLARVNISLAVENTTDTGPEHFNELFARLQRLLPRQAADRVGMCFDLGHASLYAHTRNDYLAYLDRLEEHVPLVHVHAHENYGDRDAHLPLFTGPAALNPTGLEGFVDRLRARSFTGAIILEQWPDPPALLVQARQRLRELLHDSADEHEGALSLGQ